MDWYRRVLLVAMALMPFVHSWSPIPSSQRFSGRRRNEISPYLDLVLCPIREQPWSCARQQSGRILDAWDTELHSQWQKLKVEADIQLNSTMERRGYSNSEFVTKEKPSTILKKIEIGTDYMKEYLAETMDGFLGNEYEYTNNFKNHNGIQNDQPIDNDEPADDVDDNDDDDDDDNDNDDDSDDNDDDVDDDGQATPTEDEEETESDDNTGDVKNSDISNDGTATGDEFIDIEAAQDEETIGQLKKPGGGNKRKKKKNKNKKKGDQHDLAAQAANLLVIQPLEHQLAQHHDDDDGHGDGHAKPIRIKTKPTKQKKRKRKKKGQAGHDDVTTVVLEQQPSSDHLSLGLLEELANVELQDEGGKRKKHPMKYGRSNGVTRGKKKKKKKALMKVMLLASFLKAKIELLLKILGAHLQIKFFAIALIGLLINIARFWIDVKRGGAPQKVVYVEHAHHQHHYEDHGEDWNESGGGYWKRSLQTDTPGDDYDSATDSYQPRPQAQQQQQQPYDAQYMAYRNQWQRK